MDDPKERIQADLNLRTAALALLRAPYTEMSHWAITNMCVLLDHPSRYPQGQAPPHGGIKCVCGKRVGTETI